jgi:hypothetical protein
MKFTFRRQALVWEAKVENDAGSITQHCSQSLEYGVL